jgi:CheY-like chemotaxis protein
LNSSVENEEVVSEQKKSYAEPAFAEDLLKAKEQTILIVEDTEAITIQLKDFLEARDYHILIARNGEEALKILEKKIPNAMILDLMMPGVDGFEVLRRIRSEERTVNIPVIVLTAKYITRDEHAALMQDNVYQLIQKGNINREQLLKTIARMMNAGNQNSDEKKLNLAKVQQKPVKKMEYLVLIIEDNPDNMITLKALLDGKCSIIEASDGRTGISMAAEQRPDLILTDIALPEITGIEVLKELRKNPQLKATPVIAVTASAMKGEKEALLKAGFSNYISKPIDFSLFNAVIDELLT